MSDESVHELLVGIDWGAEEHEVVAIDRERNIVYERRVQDSGPALAELCQELTALIRGDRASIGIAIETAHGHLAATLDAEGFGVYTLNPKQLDRFRDRFSPAGAKDDHLDALVLAKSLTTDFECFTRVEFDDELTAQLREWSRLREELVSNRVGQFNRLRDVLRVHFPQLLRAVGDLDNLWVLDLLEKCPTPAHAKKLRKKWLEGLLRKRRVRSTTAEDLLTVLREQPVIVAPGIVEAKGSHVRLLVAQIRLTREHMQTAEAEIESFLQAIHEGQIETLASEGERDGQSDVEILLSLPGLGKITAATLLAEARGLLARRDYRRLRSVAGAAPVTRRTGKQKHHPNRKRKEKRQIVTMRRACDARLRRALHCWADVARARDPKLKAKYATYRARGQTHGQALRNIGDRLLFITCALLENRSLYNPELQPVCLDAAAA